MSPSEAVEHAIVFSNLRADGPAPRFAPLRRRPSPPVNHEVTASRNAATYNTMLL